MTTRHTINTAGLTWREIDGEVVILDLEHSRYLSLNGTGAFLWRALADGVDDGELAALLSDRYDLDRDRATRDIAVFLERCTALGLVR